MWLSGGITYLVVAHYICMSNQIWIGGGIPQGDQKELKTTIFSFCDGFFIIFLGSPLLAYAVKFRIA